jgi:hypothetical protein
MNKRISGIKILTYSIVGCVLLIASYLISFFLPHFFYKNWVSILFLIILYIKTDLIIHYLNKKLNIIVGQLFLFSTFYKIIFSFGFLFLMKLKSTYFNKSTFGFFMIWYFVFLITEIILFSKELNR